MTVKFKALEEPVFGAYQHSSTGTQKWHLLDHLVDSIKNVGGIQFLHGDFHEGSDKVFKTVCSECPKRRGSAMDDAVRKYNAKSLDEHLLGRTGEHARISAQYTL